MVEMKMMMMMMMLLMLMMMLLMMILLMMMLLMVLVMTIMMMPVMTCMGLSQCTSIQWVYILSRTSFEMHLKNKNTHDRGEGCHTQGEAVVDAWGQDFKIHNIWNHCQIQFKLRKVDNLFVVKLSHTEVWKPLHANGGKQYFHFCLFEEIHFLGTI